MRTKNSRRPHTYTPLALMLMVALSLTERTALARADGCSPVSVGTDTSSSNSACAFMIGQACGQIFEARDTILEAVTVWRHPGCNITPLRLYVMELDSTGAPDVNRILRLGPTVQNVCGDSIHAVRFRFELDPPLSLPRPGHYEFAVQTAPPYCDFGGSMLADTRDLYPGGAAWEHNRSFLGYSDCPLVAAQPLSSSTDLIFQLEFCEPPTPVRRTSWGDLKVRYR